jgi:phage shock protein PspC (stress-responsive transcriptional regulator)
MLTKKFWADTAERVISGVIAGMLAVIGAGTFDIMAANWRQILAVGLGAGFVVLLKCLGASQVNDPNSASLIL